MEWQREQYSISTDKSKLDLKMIHHYLYTHGILGGGSSDELGAQIDREFALFWCI